MGNNKSLLLNFQQQQKQQECSLIINVGTANTTASLPIGLNKFSSSPLSTNTQTSAGFLKRIIHNDFIKPRKLNAQDLLTNETNHKMKSKKKFSIKNKLFDKNLNNNNNSNASITVKHQIKFSINTNEIVIEPDYTSLNDCNLIEQKIKQESFYESALEMYELISNNKNNLKTNTLDCNLYSQVNKPESNSILLIPNQIQFKRYHLQSIANFFHRIKNTKINHKKLNKQQSLPPELPTNSFNPAKEFIYEQTKYKDESNIYFKIGKQSEDEEDETDFKRTVEPPPLPPKLIQSDYQTMSDYEGITSIKDVLTSSSASSTSSSLTESIEANHPPPLPPLPAKLSCSQIEPFDLNNQVYYSFSTQERLDNNLIENEYYTLGMETFLSRVNLMPTIDYCKSTCLLMEHDLLNSDQTSSTNTLNSNLTSPKISSCASLSNSSNASCINQDDLNANIIKL